MTNHIINIVLYFIITILISLFEVFWPFKEYSIAPTLMAIILLYCLIRYNPIALLIISFSLGFVFDFFTDSSYLGASAISFVITSYILVMMSKGLLLSRISSLFILLLISSFLIRISTFVVDHFIINSEMDLGLTLLTIPSAIITALLGSYILIRLVPSLSSLYK